MTARFETCYGVSYFAFNNAPVETVGIHDRRRDAAIVLEFRKAGGQLVSITHYQNEQLASFIKPNPCFSALARHTVQAAKDGSHARLESDFNINGKLTGARRSCQQAKEFHALFNLGDFLQEFLPGFAAAPPDMVALDGDVGRNMTQQEAKTSISRYLEHAIPCSQKPELN